MTSYGPVTASAEVTPSIWPTSLVTSDPLPTFVWMRMYAPTMVPSRSRALFEHERGPRRQSGPRPAVRLGEENGETCCDGGRATGQTADRPDQPLPPPARSQPGRLVTVGARSARTSEAGGQADPALDRLRGLPLVPRHGPRIVRGSGDRPAHERALRLRQGRPRGAPRPRLDLHGRGPGHDGVRRLAHDRLPDRGRQAVLRGDVLPTGGPSRPARVP